MSQDTEVPVAVPQDQVAETTPAAQAEAPKSDGQEQAEQPQEDEKPRESKGVQKRLDELRRREGDAQRLAERAFALLERTLTKGETPRAEVPSGPPQKENFESYEAYLEAKADYQIAKRLEGIEKAAAETRQREAEAKREETWTKKVTEASKKYDDFDEVAFAEDLPIAPAMAAAMRDSDLGPDVAYYLGKNPSEAQRISQLSPAAQVREIGKIEARLEMKPVRQPSKAPPPIDPVGSGKGSSSVNLESMTQAEYEAYRAKTWAKRF